MFNTFGRFVWMKTIKKYVICLVLLVVTINHVLGQHYFFVEADGMQPFYIKKADTLFSSNAIGFIILSRNYQSELTFSIGFPQNKFPEIIFSLSAMDHDRGFQLKKLDEKGWVLFDLETFEVFQPNLPLEVKKQEVVESVGTSVSEFGKMLAEVTDDNTLLEIATVPISISVKPSSVNKTNEKKAKGSSAGNVKNGIAIKPLSQSKVRLLSQDTSSMKSAKLTYVDQLSSKKADTIEVEIVYPESIGTSLQGMLVSIANAVGDSVKPVIGFSENSKDTVSDLLIARDSMVLEHHSSDQDSVTEIPSVRNVNTKEISRVRRKLLGISTLEEQLSYLEKIYTTRHYTTEQTKEIGWFFVSENERLRFFRLIVQLISDIENVNDLQHVFLKEDSIKMFKENISDHF